MWDNETNVILVDVDSITSGHLGANSLVLFSESFSLAEWRTFLFDLQCFFVDIHRDDLDFSHSLSHFQLALFNLHFLVIRTFVF